jgi:hypothetical protein
LVFLCYEVLSRKKDFADNGPKALELAEETLSDEGSDGLSFGVKSVVVAG